MVTLLKSNSNSCVTRYNTDSLLCESSQISGSKHGLYDSVFFQDEVFYKVSSFDEPMIFGSSSNLKLPEMLKSFYEN